MKLSVKDRVLLPQLFPERSNLLEMMTVSYIQKKIEIGDKESKEIHLRQEGERVVWDDDAKSRNVEFSETDIKFLDQQVTRLDNERKISLDLLDLCEAIREEVKKLKEGGK